MELKKLIVTYNGKDMDIGNINPDELSGLEIVGLTKEYMRMELGLEPPMYPTFFYCPPNKKSPRMPILCDNDLMNGLHLLASLFS